MSLPFNNFLHFSDISSLEREWASSGVIISSLTEHCVIWVSGAISILSLLLILTFPYVLIIKDQ